MRFKNLILAASLTALCVGSALVVTDWTTPKAEAQTPLGAGAPLGFNNFTNIPAQIPANTLTNCNSVIPLRKNQGVAIWMYFNGSNANNNTLITANFTVSRDGTNYSTAPPINVGASANGTTAVLYYTNLQPTTLNNARFLQLTTITNSVTNAVFMTNVAYSYFN